MRQPTLDATLRGIGRRIAEVRNQRNMTQEALAERLGVATRNLQALERGKRNATVATLLKTAAALRVELAELFTPPRTPAARPGRPRRNR